MPAEDVHVHVHVHVDHGDHTTELLERLSAIETQLTIIGVSMSDTSAALTGLTDAITSAMSRIDEDVAHLQDLLEQALASDAADAATIQQLRDEAAATVASINEQTARLTAIDPVADFPAPPEEPPVEEPPVEEPPA